MKRLQLARLVPAILGVVATCLATGILLPVASASAAGGNRPLVAAADAKSLHARDIRADSGTVAGVTDVNDAQKLERVANMLGQAFATPPAAIVARLQRLRAVAGNSVYVQLQHGGGPARLVLTPAAEDRAALLVNGEVAVPVSQTPRRNDNTIAVFWVERGSEREYPLRIPASVTHLTLVVNGKEVAVTRPIRIGDKPVSISLN